MTANPNPPVIRPSDAVSWDFCRRRVWLDNKRDFEIESSNDEFQQLIIALGVRHEQDVLDRLGETLKIYTATSPEDTQRLMAKGVDVIYQAQLVDNENGYIGYPDLLLRHENGGYQAADAKLSLSVDKKPIKVQLGLYRRILGFDLPAIVFLGNGETDEIGDETNIITNQFVNEMRGLLEREVEPRVRYSHSKCSICPYYSHCNPSFESQEELSLLYGVQGRAAQGLEDAGFDTISTLAVADPTKLPDVPYLKGFEHKQRAVLQAKSYLSGNAYQLSTVDLPKGSWVHFDIEDNPPNQ